MHCLVYRSTRRSDTYLLTDRGDRFDHIPPKLLSELGHLVFAFEFTLTPERHLARTDGATVMHQIERHGYYLQMPDQSDDEA